MSTHSKTTIYDERNKPILSFYRQFDGYVDGGHGEELVKFLEGFQITNGLGGRKTANGMQCLAAQVLTHFKRKHGGQSGILPGGTTNGLSGGIYICDHDAEEEYNYSVKPDGPSNIRCLLQVHVESNGVSQGLMRFSKILK